MSKKRDLVDPDTGTPDAFSAAFHAIPHMLTVASCHLGGSRSSYSSKLLLGPYLIFFLAIILLFLFQDSVM